MFWRAAAWSLRVHLAVIYLCFGVMVLARNNIPLLFKSYSHFDDLVPFWWWGAASLVVSVGLLVIPTRVPWGLLTTLLSMTLSFTIGATFVQGGGLLPGAILFFIFGLGSGALFTRALWMYAVQVRWFREHVIEKGVNGG
ncbi:hypothetical protein [Deinococcus frigens]|uniref:hypothetical protein n=1 Tax=Deinococcus frigens TaxID=249403 RepID=UPI000496EF8C|nr:hypothetical protein [Deinococcus frigens]